MDSRGQTIAGLVGLALLGTVTAVAAPSPTSNRGDIGPDYVDWSSVGDTFDYLGTSFNATSVGGVKMKISGSEFGFIRLDEGNGWIGNFDPDDPLNYTDWQPATVDITFNSPVFGAGAQIQPELYGDFRARLTAYYNGSSVVSHTFSGTSTDGQDDSAIFAGFVSSDAEIKRLVFEVDDGEGVLGFAINQLQVNGPVGPRPVPEGRPYGEIVWFVLLGLGAWMQRARRQQSA